MSYLIPENRFEQTEYIAVSSEAEPSAEKKWTYMVYFATDNNLEECALYDIIRMQQANLDPGIDIYVLADRPANAKQCYESINGTYEWDSQWTDTRVGKITADPGLTVTVDWESWGELDTGSPETLKRFVNWVGEQSAAENYCLIMWDHGSEDATLCTDETPDPDNFTLLKISDVADVVKENGKIPLVMFNNCLLGSEVVATQMAGTTEVIVNSEPPAFAQATFSYKFFFDTITADMTPGEIADVMVRNVQPVPGNGDPTMLSAINVRDARLGDALETFAKTVYLAGSETDMNVLIDAMKKAAQDGCVYDGSVVQQSDLYDLILQVMAHRDYEKTSESFKTALANVKSAFEAVVLSFRSVPSGHGFGIAYFNTVFSAMKFIASGSSEKKSAKVIGKCLDGTYGSNPVWGNLLYDLCLKFLVDEAENFYRPANFTVTWNADLASGKVVPVSDLGCFSGKGATFDGVTLLGDYYFKVAVTAADTSTGTFRVENSAGADVTVSLLAGDGTVVKSGVNVLSFADLAPADYYLRLQSDAECRICLSFDADWATGVDRMDYAKSGLNVKNADGNGSFATATPLSEGYYPGLLTSANDPDIYLIGNLYAEQYKVAVESSTVVQVAEYDRQGVLVQEAEFSGGIFALTMTSQNFLCISGSADLDQNKVDSYSIYITDVLPEAEVRIDNPAGTPDGVSWQATPAAETYLLDLSTDDFTHVLRKDVNGNSLDLLNLPAGTYQWRVKAEDAEEWTVGGEIVSENLSVVPIIIRSEADGDKDLFCAVPNGTWEGYFCARHTGSAGNWTGTGEMVSAAGKNRIRDLFFGSADPSVLALTDSENGDALFMDDIYTDLPEALEGNTARLFRIQEILAGGGDDIVDMTSGRFEYTGDVMNIRGGDGNDTIWADRIGSRLFGDDGNDRLVGSSGGDLIVGGSGNDSMHGGGGEDIFTFCADWGVDTVEQIEGGTVTLWFASGSEENWDGAALTYTDGENRVSVSGVGGDKIALRFGNDGSMEFRQLSSLAAFERSSSKNIFEEPEDKGAIASL